MEGRPDPSSNSPHSCPLPKLWDDPTESLGFTSRHRTSSHAQTRGVRVFRPTFVGKNDTNTPQSHSGGTGNRHVPYRRGGDEGRRGVTPVNESVFSPPRLRLVQSLTHDDPSTSTRPLKPPHNPNTIPKRYQQPHTHHGQENWTRFSFS